MDGTVSVVILKKAIEMAGGEASFHVPHRLKDGYGMRADVIERAAAMGVALIISVDTGIRASEVVRGARELGIDVIVTDHHLPDAELPPALAVLNPNRRDCHYPDKNLCGAGVAFKLVHALLATLGWPEEKLARMLKSFLKLVAIATVADVVPLVGENRVIVKHGLEGLHRVQNPGLRALLEVSGLLDGRAPSARQVAFQIAPRINAAGRMDDAQNVIRMFLTDDLEHARTLGHAASFAQSGAARDRGRDRASGAGGMRAGSGYRRSDRAGILRTQLASRRGGDCGQPLGGALLPARVCAERRRWRGARFRPQHRAVSLAGRAGIHAGSVLALRRASAGGGREHAVGMVPEFRQRLEAYANASALLPADFQPRLAIDAMVDLRELTTGPAVEEILALAPFGFGNPPPVLAILDAEIAAAPVVMKEKHLRVHLRQNGRNLLSKAWNFAGRAAELAAGARIDAAFCIEEDPYSESRGWGGWAAVLKDVRPSGSTAPNEKRETRNG